MHIAGADRPDERLVAFAAEREDDEHAVPLFRSPYGSKTAFALRMGRIWNNGQRAREKIFDGRTESPCFSHLTRLPLSQSKPFTRKAMTFSMVCNCIGKCQAVLIRGAYTCQGTYPL